jgi:type I restriction enzyme, R subunit
VIDYIEQNGYVENLAELTKPTFDKKRKFAHIINAVKENAMKVIS